MNDKKTKADDSSISNNDLDGNLIKFVQGTGTNFIGSIIGLLLALIVNVMVARFYSVSEYGLYAIVLLILSFSLRFATMGLGEGSTRFISYHRGKNEKEKIKGTIISTLIIASISSIATAILFFFLADFIAIKIFHIDELSNLIKIISIAIPFWIFLNLIIGFFRGFERTREKIFFMDLIINLFRVGIFIFIIFLGLSLSYIIFAYTLSIIITFLATFLYFFKKIPDSIRKVKAEFNFKPLLSFSLPILISTIGWFIFAAANKIMLGILKSDYEVGIYNVADSVAANLTIFLSSSVFIFLPIATSLFARNKNELKRYYQVVTKWIFMLTFPFIVVILLFPITVISIIFGEKYISATLALQLLTLGASITIATGPNNDTIIVLGKTKLIMFLSLFGAALNICLNYLMIPLFSYNGAAFSAMFSLILQNIFLSSYLFFVYRIHPFTKNFIKPLLIYLPILLFSHYLILHFNLEYNSLLFKAIICMGLILLYFVIIIMLKSFDEEDLQFFNLFEKKIGFRFNLLRKIIKKFM